MGHDGCTCKEAVNSGTTLIQKLISGQGEVLTSECAFAGNLCRAQPRVGLVLPVRETVAMFCATHGVWRLRQLGQRSKDHSHN